ncbi:MAG: response regulator [Thermoleophilia bacterium]|nr:response regulator [Thermoleophilia bacterium]
MNDNDIRLLLVDDEEEFIKALAERLNLRDLAGHTAFNGVQALEYVEENEPQVMVLDLRMPGIDGMEVLRTVRRKYPLMQVIVHTAHGNDLDEAEAWQLGIYDYLRKPVEIDLLIDRIRGAYRRSDELRNSMKTDGRNKR